MRFDDRVQCLSVINYEDGTAIISLQCKKDCRHGHGKKRQSALYHRADFLTKDGWVQVRWKVGDGKGIMPPEMIERRRIQAEKYAQARSAGRTHTTWDGDHAK